jgi:glycosyltransferase involved in cell wall biosynthesis
MEALALSRPVISTYVAGIPELVENGTCGWLVPAGDVTGLAEAMISCLQCSDEALQGMGMQGRSRVLAQHDIRNSASGLLKIFSAVAMRK